MLQQFINQLESKDLNLEQTRAMWNQRADEFSAFEADSIPLSFIQKRMSLEGKSVIDIGFGGGRYLAEFAKHGMELYGIELSDNMHAHAVDRLKKQGASFESEHLIRSSWEELDIDKLGWRNKFDLVFLSFSPAISSYREFEKILAIAKEGIYLSSHMLRQDSLLEELYKEFDVEPDRGFIGKLFPLFNLFVEHGYFPDVEFTNEEQERELVIEDSLMRYTHWIFGSGYTDEQKEAVHEAMKKRMMDGRLITGIKEINGYFFVDLKKRRG